jgi:hypothetical protein
LQTALAIPYLFAAGGSWSSLREPHARRRKDRGRHPGRFCRQHSGRRGSGTFPAAPAGTYYLTISVKVSNNEVVAWEQPIRLHPGPNTITLDLSNAAPVH